MFPSSSGLFLRIVSRHLRVALILLSVGATPQVRCTSETFGEAPRRGKDQGRGDAGLGTIDIVGSYSGDPGTPPGQARGRRSKLDGGIEGWVEARVPQTIRSKVV